jgi:hypothetical protein
MRNGVKARASTSAFMTIPDRPPACRRRCGVYRLHARDIDRVERPDADDSALPAGFAPEGQDISGKIVSTLGAT